MSVNQRKDLLKSKGRMFIFDEKATVKDWIEYTLVDNVRIMNPPNPVEIKSPSGVTVFQTLDLDASISCDWYHPGDLTRLELLARGVTSVTTYDGATAQTEEVIATFRANNEAFPLPGFDGDGTVVTINSVKDITETTTYTVTTDYTVSVDAQTGMSYLTHVSTGSIPLNADLVVNYDYTPLASKILKPNYEGSAVFRHVKLVTYPDPSDATKYRTYYLPNCVIETELGHSLLEIGQDNTSPNILPITFKHAKPDAGSRQAKWYYQDTINV